jgi:hypothetical protein
VEWPLPSRGAGGLTWEAVTLAERIAFPTDTTANTIATAAKTRAAFLKTSDDTTFLTPDSSVSSWGPDRKRGMGSLGEKRSFIIG